jgi:hypothetical protein
MSFSFTLPGDETTTTETTTDETTDAVFPERDDDYEAYRATVETYRFVRKLAESQLFPERAGSTEKGERVTNKEIEALAGRSPLADHFKHYKAQKKEIKNGLKEARENGDRPKSHSLPTYKDEWPEPEYEYEHVTEDDLTQLGIHPGTWYDRDEDGIKVPAEYSPETDDDGTLMVWYPGEDLDMSDEDKGVMVKAFLRVAADTDGIGEKTLAALKENVEKSL